MPTRLLLDKAPEFDVAVHEGLPIAGDIPLISKAGATVGGLPSVVVAFAVGLPGGEIASVQGALTLRELLTAAIAFDGYHSEHDAAWKAADRPLIAVLDPKAPPPPSGAFAPSAALLCKLGSLIVHAVEGASNDGHPFDALALASLLQDPEVRAWLDEMKRSSLLPRRRDGQAPYAL